MMIDVLTLPFDQYGRYTIVRDAIAAMRPAVGAKLRILDIGGHFRTRRGIDVLPAQLFLPDDVVTVVDRIDLNLPGYVRGDGRGLAFPDASFDVVISCDTLEHIPSADRASFWDELLRVARAGVLLIAPDGTPRTVAAERLLLSFIRAELGHGQPQLEEHAAFGLPTRAQNVALLAARGVRFAERPSGDIDTWLAMMLVRHTPDLGGDVNFIEQLDAYYNAELAVADRCDPAYRRLYLVEKAGGWLDAATNALAPTAAAVRIDWGSGVNILLASRQLRAEERRRVQDAALLETIHAQRAEIAWRAEQVTHLDARAAWLDQQLAAVRHEHDALRNGRVMRLLTRKRRTR